ncbi:hypothetical protein DCO58_05675 [Helicobacter saguini]|uniref:Uncharacterized protein n=1 Tax=Helicobacter saguini TaxID=1548018 RepID=A0A6B0HN86_9HELI|nr:hypothetical protein [Helicobacter saguini]MWV62163.1 hypothetical protein [Helicobacter saguini]MWV67164.1 hypothetical protein [Helicobacter saguini]MWV69516.1 hypothetical protein [Helicobacter saguini]MWV70933.1 hypothetical protein [Helicobacter saguini]
MTNLSPLMLAFLSALKKMKVKRKHYAFSPSQINKNNKEKPLDLAYQNIIEIYEKSPK